VRGIIAGLGGSISCESQVGVGTLFTILLKPCEARRQPTSYRSPAPPTISEQFVLVADDDELVREVTVEMLTALGYRCKQATGGLDCQRILAEERSSFFAMVIDCRMPDCDGTTICQRLRQEGDRLPIILMSGLVSDSLNAQQTTDHRTRFLSKPFTHNQLAAVFDAMFSDKRQRQRTDDGSSSIALMVTDVIRQRQEEEQRRSPG
jgi:CheY-like chemotaxis protein